MALLPEIQAVLDGKARWSAIEAECLAAMKSIPDACVHSIVTDPPYGLGDSSREDLPHVFLSTLFDVFFPKLDKTISKAFNTQELGRPLDRAAFLNQMNRSVWVEPGISVPEGSVDFNGEVVDWNEEVKHADKPPAPVPDGELANILKAHRIKNGNRFFLKLRACVDASLGNGATVGFPESGFGRLGVFVVIPFNSAFAGFLRALAPCSAPGLGDVIRLLNNPKAFAESPATVMTGAGAELRAILTLDMGGGLCELSPAYRARQVDAVFELVCPQKVGALTGTGSLAAMFEPRSFSLVGASADGTFSLCFHSFILPYIMRKSSGFMGKSWDADVPSTEIWQAALRVAKPGCHLLAFGGTRTFHRLACAIEDAGWELRDTIGVPHQSGDWGDCPWILAWVHGQGFPKSHNVGLRLDKLAGHGDRGHRIAVANRHHPDGTLEPNGELLPPYEAKSEEGKKWQGWGTALKPAWEPIIVARKPLDGTVAQNVLTHGTGAINVDGCRVGTTDNLNGGFYRDTPDEYQAVCYGKHKRGGEYKQPSGRWPANLIHDGEDEVLEMFPVMKTNSTGTHHTGEYASNGVTGWKAGAQYAGDSGSAARFFKCCPDDDIEDAEVRRLFYCAKASRADRNEGCDGLPEARSVDDDWVSENRKGTKGGGKPTTQRNAHPTVKPTALMRYLCRLVTPPGGVVLDPFCGSGSTGKAAILEGFRFIGIELSSEYVEIAKARIQHVEKIKPKKAKKRIVVSAPAAAVNKPATLFDIAKGKH